MKEFYLNLSREQLYTIYEALGQYIEHQNQVKATKEPTTLDWYDALNFNIKMAENLKQICYRELKSERGINNMIYETIIKFAKVRPTAKIPTKRPEDAGYDIYADFEEDYIRINPHETVMIPTGLASACDPEYYFELKERGSTGTKGLAQRCGIIDSGYRNEWFVPITNTTNHIILIAKKDRSPLMWCDYPSDTVVYPYEKAICQVILRRVPTAEVEEITYDELKEIKSERGLGALGSSGK